MTSRTIPNLTPAQSEQARELRVQLLLTATAIASGDEKARRHVLKFLLNSIKRHLDGVSAPEKVKLTAMLREWQDNQCPVCEEPMPLDPDEVEKHRTNRNQGYTDPSTIQLRCRGCHRAEHEAEWWS